MTNKFYISAWILLATIIFVTVLSGSFNPAALLGFGLVASAVLMSLVMRSVIAQTRKLKTWQPTGNLQNLIIERRNL